MAAGAISEVSNVLAAGIRVTFSLAAIVCVGLVAMSSSPDNEVRRAQQYQAVMIAIMFALLAIAWGR